MQTTATGDGEESQLQLSEDDPQLVAGRYEVQRLLGRGGMAAVYRVHDTQTDTDVALKRMCVRSQGSASRAVELFEREYHTLTQLAHPRIIQVFDYGVDDELPYYTMEVLDGGDLRELARMPWQEVCLVAYEVCSALSLLHSRKLVHRDLTPRNVRRASDGKAKLIDFGLLAQMGPASMVAGTPPYVAPELVQSMTLDGRGDIFSLGATLYYALTGHNPYRARKFEHLRDAWRGSPPPPSRYVQDIPPAVDRLILAMVRVDAGSRPKSVAEVMERLRPLLTEPPDEDLGVAGAYLNTPQLVGRTEPILAFRKRMLRATRTRGGGFSITGDAGVGRSRMLEAFVMEAKLMGVVAVRASASDAAAGPFGVATAIAQQLLSAEPERAQAAATTNPEVYRALFGTEPPAGAAVLSKRPPPLADLSRPELERSAAQAALSTWLAAVADKRPLAIAVDDVDQADEPSASMLASLALELTKRRLVYAVTLTRNSVPTAPAAIDVLRERAQQIELPPLTEDELLKLLASLFGEVPHLQLLCQRLYALCEGRPRECIALAQHLVDHRAITYGGGAWSLPSELSADMLPSRMEEALEAQVAALSPAARRIGRLLAVGVMERLSRAQLTTLPGLDTATVDRAVDELLSARIATGTPAGYALCNEVVSGLLTQNASPEALAEVHRELANVYADAGGDEIPVIYHYLRSNDRAPGLARVLARTVDGDSRNDFFNDTVASLGVERAGEMLTLAIEESERAGRLLVEQQRIYSILAASGASGADIKHYYRVPRTWLSQLRHDSGRDIWETLDPSLDPPTRALMAIAAASERFEATPEAERVQPPIDAIKVLMAYVVFSIAVAVRTRDVPLMATLPGQLEPFAPLNPMVRAMTDNARATFLNGLGQQQAAMALFTQVVHQLDEIDDVDMSYVHRVRAAICQTITEVQASLGIQPNIEHLEKDEAPPDPAQEVGAMYVRKIAALNRGDWEAAEEYRQRAELLALENRAGEMFSTLGQELEAHALARDLTGLRAVRAGIAGMAERYPGWVPVKHVADAYYRRLVGDQRAALEAIEALREREARQAFPSPWLMHAVNVEVEVLLDQGRREEALAAAEAGIAVCGRDNLKHLGRLLSGATAMAEAALGRYVEATARVKAVVADQKALGITGLMLGRSFEQLARIGIWAGDQDQFGHNALLAAGQYRPGRSAVLGALYEVLMEEARSAGMASGLAHALDSFTSESSAMTGAWSHIDTMMADCQDRTVRAQRALGLLSDGDPPRKGHLFLMTPAGLTLCASNTPCADPTRLSTHAQGLLELELDESMCTMTAADLDAAFDSDTATGWLDDDGIQYFPLMLRATVLGQLHVVGIALLSGSDQLSIESHAEVASALAKHLIESGDYVGIAAA